jgi:hypothetical protein
LEADFDFLRGASVDRLLISDPYVTTNDSAFESLKSLFGIWNRLWKQPPKAITVQYSQAVEFQDRRLREQIAQKTREFLCSLSSPSPEVMVFELPRLRNRDFHDRRIEFNLSVGTSFPLKRIRRAAGAAQSNGTQRVVVELSGGIYRLMTVEKECRLYRIMES